MAPSSFHIPDFDSDLPTPPPTHHLVLKKEPFPWDVASAASTSTAQPTAHFRGKRILVIGLTIFTAIALLLVGLFIQIFVTHEYLHQDLVIITTAPLGPTLSIVHVLSILLVMSVPLVVGLEGYRLAGLWLSASASSGHNRPTPFQLGVLMNVLHGANFAALFEGLHYVYGFGKNKLTSYKPPLLRRAVFVLAFALGVSTLFFVLGTALSISAETTSFTRLSDYRGTWPQLSRQINSSMCADSNGAVAADINLCGLQVAGTNPFAASLPEALQTLTNTSTKNAVAFASDQTAFIVPASIPQDVVYSAASYGIYTQCESVTELCVGSGPSYGPDTSLDLNCPASVSFNPEPVSGTYVFGVLDNNGNLLTQPYLVDSNPFHFGAVVASKLYTSENDTFVGTTGFFTHGTEGAYNVLSCTVSVRSLTYSYSNGSYLVQSTQMDSTNLDLTRTVAAMSGSGPLPSRVSAAVEGAGLASVYFLFSFFDGVICALSLSSTVLCESLCGRLT
ncbi:hypothetical protein C8J57DRAFT_1212836 [Mycena rebaudengoi]|nr:hypothetical protein C8J57DRAFT_1212836 [Mycena rebaudengoi]